MGKAAFLFIVLALFATPALAALDALSTIAQYESGNQNIVNSKFSPQFTASGPWQINVSTWNSQVVGNVPGATTVSFASPVDTLPLDLQQAGAAYLYQTQGFSPWTCPGCNAALAAYVAQQGGPSAFSLSTPLSNGGPTFDPGGTFSSADPTGGGGTDFSSYDFSSGTFGGGSSWLSAADPSVNIANGLVTSTPGVLSLPFTWMDKQLTIATQATMQVEITQMQTMVATYIRPLLTLVLMAFGIRMSVGNAQLKQIASWILGLSIVLPLVAVGSAWYQQFVVGPVLGLPIFWQSYVMGNTSGFAAGSSVAMLDWVYNATYAVEVAIWNSTPWSLHSTLVGGELLVTRMIIVLSLCALYAPIGVLKLLSMLLLMVGSVCIPFGLHERTAPIAWGWLWAVVTVLLTRIAIDLVLTLYTAIMLATMQVMTVSGTAETDTQSFGGAAIAMFLMGLTVFYVPRIFERIGHGVSVSLDHASYHMTAGPLRDAATAPVNLARRYVGI